jgi:hypothetical protein
MPTLRKSSGLNKLVTEIRAQKAQKRSKYADLLFELFVLFRGKKSSTHSSRA